MSDLPISAFPGMDNEAILRELETSRVGIPEEEAEKRLLTFGKNILSEKKRYSLLFEFLSHFQSPLIVIMLIASVISFFVHETMDGVIIAVIVLLSIILDFFLEHNAEKASEKLKESVNTTAIVVRGGHTREVNISDVCPGDILLLSAGNLVAADARIIAVKDCYANQSALTGESYPAEKTCSGIDRKNLAITDMTNMLFMGTSIVSGSATAVVVKTGRDTQFGKISDKLASREAPSEFDRGIKGFGELVMKATLAIVILIFFINALMRRPFFESFMFAIAIAVGLTPELLPIIMSVMMAKGSLQMAKQGVIVKKVTSIPNFGSMDILCTDKTGTLTEDKIKLVKYTDTYGNDSENVLRFAYLNSFFQTGIKNPLDKAVLEKQADIDGYSKIEEIPFDFVRKKMSVVVEKGAKRYLITKGAPEEVFKSCTTVTRSGKSYQLKIQLDKGIIDTYDQFSNEGYRVLAVAIKEVSGTSFSKADEADMQLIGFISFLDPAKADVGEVVKELQEKGIEIKVITGDNELVTKKICREIGLEIKGIMLGSDISTMTDDALRVKVEQTTIFARFSPDEKNRVIGALRLNGHVVGYMGDGINDAPSLKTADIGISVNSAVDVAKEAADIILTQKSLRSLHAGVLEGRKTFANTLKYIKMGLSSNFGNMFSVIFAILYLPFLPILPLQILLNNFIYDFSQITIPTDNVDPELIDKPRRWDIKAIKRFMLIFGPVSSLFDIITFLVLFHVFGLNTPDKAIIFQTCWFLESLATQSLVIFVIRTKKIPFIESMPSPFLVTSAILCILFGWLLPHTAVGSFFYLVPADPAILGAIAAIVLIYLMTVELAKRLYYMISDI